MEIAIKNSLLMKISMAKRCRYYLRRQFPTRQARPCSIAMFLSRSGCRQETIILKCWLAKDGFIYVTVTNELLWCHEFLNKTSEHYCLVAFTSRGKMTNIHLSVKSVIQSYCVSGFISFYLSELRLDTAIPDRHCIIWQFSLLLKKYLYQLCWIW